MASVSAALTVRTRKRTGAELGMSGSGMRRTCCRSQPRPSNTQDCRAACSPTRPPTAGAPGDVAGQRNQRSVSALPTAKAAGRMTAHGTAMPTAQWPGRWKEAEGRRSGISRKLRHGSRKTAGRDTSPRRALASGKHPRSLCCGHPSRLRRRDDEQSNPSSGCLHLLLLHPRSCILHSLLACPLTATLSPPNKHPPALPAQGTPRIDA
ncbi:hypothetical protein B0J12DRAFT_52038 [Macrophomina phaseolina]|uniref:Uncharacterized protein n=1 Tax=Macrophomina phaseolina TaxID=35725 RepID=A0ABQ8GEF0_9PEZI|nr:hypothetical protein B0J12DRAFT_52038 [Macrophomina phaseolina]